MMRYAIHATEPDLYRSRGQMLSQYESATQVAKKVSEVNEHIPEKWEDFAPMTMIRSGSKMIRFNPYDYQIQVSNLIDRTRGVAITKTRQMGLTELIANKFLHKAARYPGYFAAVFSKGQEDTANIAKRVRLMASTAGLGLDNNNLKDIQVTGGGRIVFRTASPNSGRGLESVWDLLFDECGFVREISTIYGAATPAQSIPEQQGKARTILLSTPNGKQGFYYDQLSSNNGDRDFLRICRQMREGEIEPYADWVDEENWGKVIIHWRAHPLYGQNANYLDHVRYKQRLTEAQIQREYNLSFDESDTELFSQELVDQAAILEWAEPERGARYLAGCDPNDGGDDYWVTQVWDVSSPVVKKVAQLRIRQQSTSYCVAKSVELLERYRCVDLNIEGNASGAKIERFIEQAPSLRINVITTTQASKISHTDRLIFMMETEQLQFPADDPMASEMVNFVRVPGTKKRQAAPGHNDDTVMCAAIALSTVSTLGMAIPATVAKSSHRSENPWAAIPTRDERKRKMAEREGRVAPQKKNRLTDNPW